MLLLSHQSQSNLLPSDNDNSLLANNVSGHSRCSKDDDNNEQCCDDSTTATKHTNLYPLSASLRSNHANNNNNRSNSHSPCSNNNNHLNFARVSLKTIKNKIKLNASYSLTLLQNASSTRDNNNDLMSPNSHDTIIYNSNSIDSCCNNKILIKSKSITGCLNDDNDDSEKAAPIDELPSGRKISKINSISPDSVNASNDDTAASSKNNGIKSANDVVIPSSCSSTSNENNNEIVVIKSDNGDDIDERKLLNINSKRNTNPFLSDVCNDENVDEKNRQHSNANEIDRNIQLSLDDDDDDEAQSSGNSANTVPSIENSKLKNLSEKVAHSTRMEDYSHDRNLLDDIDNDDEANSEEEFCNSEVFGMRENENCVKSRKKTFVSERAMRRAMTNENEPSAIGLINNVDFAVKASIPTCSYQRHDYRQTAEEKLSAEQSMKRDKKFLKLSKKSSHLFNIIGKVGSSNGRMTSMTPSLKHVNLHYPNKTSIAPLENGDKKYFEKFQSKAKFQLIKLGQKCKILTHQENSMTLPHPRNIRTTIIKTNSNHHKKYQYYNEINKSYQLDDFIRSTHLLYNHNNLPSSQPADNNEAECDNMATSSSSAVAAGDNSNDSNSVIYKSYKSEIDLTRNLTYLDAFLNEHFEHETMTSSTMTRAATNSRQQHYSRYKKNKSSRNINYSSQGNGVEQSMMINDCAFDESIDEGDGQQQRQREKKQKQQFYDGNVTSSSFEYTAVVPKNTAKEKKARKDVQEIISGKSNTTSSSLSSSDYASVYSGGSKVSNDAKTKLISTPEESIEYYDTNVVGRQSKQKRLRSRRSSQPIPEHTNAYHDTECDQFVLFDEANFVELKNNMKKFHPDLYNSVPQFEDLSTAEFYENPQYPLDCYEDEEDGETLINPYARMNASPTINKRQLSYEDRGIQQQDYLEHFQQQLLTRDDDDGIEANEYAMKRHRPRAMTSVNPQHSNYNEKSLATRDVYYNPTASTNDLHENGRGGKFPQYGRHPHRVIVSKSKKQKGEVVLEYEC